MTNETQKATTTIGLEYLIDIERENAIQQTQIAILKRMLFERGYICKEDMAYVLGISVPRKNATDGYAE